MDPDALKQILQEQESVPPERTAQRIVVYRFRVGSVELALNATNLHGTAKGGPVLPVPGSKPALAGLYDDGEQIIPLIRLSEFLGVPSEGDTVLVARTKHWHVGLLCDEALGPEAVIDSQLTPPAPLKSQVQQAPASRQYDGQRGVVSILDLEELLRVSGCCQDKVEVPKPGTLAGGHLCLSEVGGVLVAVEGSQILASAGDTGALGNELIDVAELWGLREEAPVEERKTLIVEDRVNAPLRVGASVTFSTADDDGWLCLPGWLGDLHSRVGISGLLRHEERLAYVLDIDQCGNLPS